MSRYFAQIRTGMGQVEAVARAHGLQAAKFEWGPMDNSGRYSLLLRRGVDRRVLLSLSKDDLVACSTGQYGLGAIQAVIDAALQAR